MYHFFFCGITAGYIFTFAREVIFLPSVSFYVCIFVSNFKEERINGFTLIYQRWVLYLDPIEILEAIWIRIQ